MRAARLLAETGDCRARFPDPESLAGLAGVAPVTRQSGKHISVGFRWAVNRQLRDAVCDFAADSRHASPWAAAVYDAARARGKDHPHAVRILARAWIYVIWRCWQDGTAYDPAKHNALQRILDQQQAAGTAASPGGRPVTDAIIAALRAYAAGLTADRGRHRTADQPRRVPDPAATSPASCTPSQPQRRHTRWPRSTGTPCISALHDGQLPVCGGERRILKLAASLAAGTRLPARHPPRPGQPQPRTPDHSHPARRRTPSPRR